MKNRRSIEPSYNAQAAADKDNGIIAAHDEITDETDKGELVPMLDKMKGECGRGGNRERGGFRVFFLF